MEQLPRTLLLLRGPTCSGKSFFVQHDLQDIRVKSVYSTDDFFMIDGEYIFDSDKLSLYHEMNLRRCVMAMEKLEPFIVIDNTHLQAWELCPYVHAAMKHGYQIQLQSMPKLPLHILQKRNLERGKKSGKLIPTEVLAHHHSIYNEELTLAEIVQYCQDQDN